MYVRTQQNRRITCCRVYDHTLKTRPDILKMAAILFFFSFWGGALEVDIPLTYFKKRIQIEDENVH